MDLVVGLGNPGLKYSKNRHNFGFMAVESIAHFYGFSTFRSKFHSEFSEGTIGGRKVIIIKPQTYMNASGRAVAAVMQFYKISVEEVLVFHDELDLSPGKLKFKKGGGLAGHNGLRDIKAHIGGDFKRVRLGIGHPGDKKLVEGYTLQDFPRSDQLWLSDFLNSIAKNFNLLLEDNGPVFMSSVSESIKNYNE